MVFHASCASGLAFHERLGGRCGLSPSRRSKRPTVVDSRMGCRTINPFEPCEGSGSHGHRRLPEREDAVLGRTDGGQVTSWDQQ
ncbi:hypothetical protein GCM10007967_21630 [Xylanimonas ulmi]